jgi:hypothetical protein
MLANPKEVLTLGYQAMVRKRNTANYQQELMQKYGKAELPDVELLDILPDLHDTVEAYSYLPDTSLVTDILLLKGLAKKYKDCVYLEIGSFRGESIAAVADVAKECTSVTLGEEEMISFGMKPAYIKCHGAFSKDKSNITTVYHNSQTFDFASLSKKFDLIFVDGDHEYLGVLNDTQKVYDLLRDDNSMIVWHDYGNDVQAVRHEVLAGILDGTPKELHKYLYHVTHTMCAIFTKANIKSAPAEPYRYPKTKFRVEVTGTSM